MKLFLVLVVVAVVSARRGGGGGKHKQRHESFCDGLPGAKDAAVTARFFIKTFAEQIIGENCKFAKKKLRTDTFFGTDCINTFDEVFCYGARKFGDEVAAMMEEDEECVSEEEETEEDLAVTMTYQDMANFLASGDVDTMGKIACAHGLPCFQRLVGHVKKCSDHDEDFYSNVIEDARALLEPHMVEIMDAVNEKVLCYYGENSNAYKLLQMVRKRVTNFDDLKAMVNKYITSDTQDTVVTEVKAGLYSFFEGAEDFCDARCVGRSVDFFEELFTATHDDETCPTIGVYCGGCQDNADQFIVNSAGSIPCCTQEALGSIVGTLQSVIKKYGDLAEEIEETIIEVVEEEDISTDYYSEAKKNIIKQALCLKETYGELATEGQCMAA